MIEIPLTRGKVALIDDEDADRVSAYKWTSWNDRKRKRDIWYALRYVPHGDGKRRKSIRMHREILNAPDGMDVDHINGNGLDNRRSNLRLATRAENMRNSHRPIGKSGYRGVHYLKHKKNQKYHAAIIFEGKRHNLGFYACPKKAAAAYDAAAKELHGEFAALNFPNGGGD